MFVNRCARKIAQEKDNKMETSFEGMANIMTNSAHFSLILKMSIGNGDSITKSIEVSEEPKEKEEKRESREGQSKEKKQWFRSKHHLLHITPTDLRYLLPADKQWRLSPFVCLAIFVG